MIVISNTLNIWKEKAQHDFGIAANEEKDWRKYYSQYWSEYFCKFPFHDQKYEDCRQYGRIGVDVAMVADKGVGLPTLILFSIRKRAFPRTHDDYCFLQETEFIAHIPIGNTDIFLIIKNYGRGRYREYDEDKLKTLQSMDIFVIVYDITRRETFENVTKYYDDILHATGKAPIELDIMIVGTKSDRESERQVSTEEGKRLAWELKARFVEFGIHLKDHSEVFQKIAWMKARRDYIKNEPKIL